MLSHDFVVHPGDHVGRAGRRRRGRRARGAAPVAERLARRTRGRRPLPVAAGSNGCSAAGFNPNRMTSSAAGSLVGRSAQYYLYGLPRPPMFSLSGSVRKGQAEQMLNPHPSEARCGSPRSPGATLAFSDRTGVCEFGGPAGCQSRWRLRRSSRESRDTEARGPPNSFEISSAPGLVWSRRVIPRLTAKNIKDSLRSAPPRACLEGPNVRAQLRAVIQFCKVATHERRTYDPHRRR